MLKESNFGKSHARKVKSESFDGALNTEYNKIPFSQYLEHLTDELGQYLPPPG